MAFMALFLPLPLPLLYLLAFLKNSFPSFTDPPSSPSRPDCAIEDLDEFIHCSWTKSNEPMIPTIYTLHWKDCDGYDSVLQSKRSHF